VRFGRKLLQFMELHGIEGVAGDALKSDLLNSKSGSRKGVWVQVPPWPMLTGQGLMAICHESFFFSWSSSSTGVLHESETMTLRA
jgi:hypothetical protein